MSQQRAPLLKPGTQFPSLDLKTLDGENFASRIAGKPLSLLVFYRGLHCGICKNYLQAFENRLEKFKAATAQVTAVSAEPQSRVEAAKHDWELANLTLVAEFPVAQALAMGLFVSAAQKDAEPDHFIEPALFILDTNSKIIFQNVQNMPFLRPDVPSLVDLLPRLTNGSLPIRGEVVSWPRV